MFTLDNPAIRKVLAPFGVDASDTLCDNIRAYSELLLRWNQKIALTTVTDPVEVVRFHFGESLFATSLLAPLGGRLADLGSGAGFPGLALKLKIPALQVTLIESNLKKSAFLSEVVRALSLEGVEVYRGRFEDFAGGRDPFDFVTARALGSHNFILNWAAEKLTPDGRIALWLGGEDASTISISKRWLWRPAQLLPESKNRYIVIGTLVK